ncbi:MAG: ECF transporter S component [Microbacterium sp.]|uniref:ECF transporter S component n=1 Tax=Microbacterium sp. TaxID=51671 RepID=UPI001AD443E1|nr:ECF transporter S component [Microbacterium sp.]MBN9178244.1 ECF transporter S component [Microbacterium sp.]MBN9188538.1 ECF transporter S component [Microbacterium sp.]
MTPRERTFFSTRTLLTLAAIGVGAGLIVIPISWVSQLVWAGAPMLYGAFVIPWVLPGVIAQAVVPRGGSALVSGLIAGLVAVPFTGGIGGLSLFLFIAAFLELPYALTLWRRWTAAMAYLAAGVLSVGYAAFWWFTLDAGRFPPVVRAITIVVLVAAILIATALGRLIAARLQRAGVGVAAGRAREVSAPAPVG